MTSRDRHRLATLCAAAGVIALTCGPAVAKLDIEDRGPVLEAGAFSMRVTNAGILGNAFFNVGRSFDPSFEFPRGSGHEALGHAELWVGARRADGTLGVSGGPPLEWRPTLDPTDHVIAAHSGQVGSLWNVDDDVDGLVDEDPVDGRDNDGDGRVDEDFGMVADQLLVSSYRDDEPAAVGFTYANGESHRPLELSVQQESRAWALPGYDRVAGYHFTIANVGSAVLRDVRCGIYADLDSRERNASGGHLNDRVAMVPYSAVVPEGSSGIHFGTYRKTCLTTFAGSLPVVYDGDAGSALPASAVVGLAHTTDPLGYVVNFAFPGAREAAAAARAPRRDTTFHYALFAQSLPPGQGGPPILDADRYAAMAGDYPTPSPDGAGDWAVLLSCGPFARLEPGEHLDLSVALVVGPGPDSMAASVIAAKMLQRGTRYSFQPDIGTDAYNVGETGITGHEICYEPPAGVVFNYDPHCPTKFYDDPAYRPLPDALSWLNATEVTYRQGRCIWTDFDCDACTGFDGKETHVPWQVGGLSPPAPALVVAAGDTSVILKWDNAPEIVLRQPNSRDPAYQFGGYRIYRLDNWRRESLLAAPERWQRIASFRPAALDLGGTPLENLIDASVASDGLVYGQTHFPVGRYRFADPEVQYGFDYLYAVTTVLTKRTTVAGAPVITEMESPLTASFDDRVVPHIAAQATGGGVWVVPNPYRARAPWERAAVPGDVFTRHVDFMGLPRAQCRIRIYTLAGDLVQTLDHDGTAGDGQQPWNLISRNGQDVESGIYLFTADSPLGHQIGKFVILR